MMPDSTPPRRRDDSHVGNEETEPLLDGGIADPAPVLAAPLIAASNMNAGNADKGPKGSTELKLRIATAMFAFMVMGMIQSTVGVSHQEGYCSWVQC